ncbi:MAG: DUF3842 family protein [Clostridia bacterium]
MIIAVIDAQGAGIGMAIIAEIRKSFGKDPVVYALGTNDTACLNMKKSGANGAVCGSDNIIRFMKSRSIDCLIGPMGIISSGGIKGEITPELSNTIFDSQCRKYIIPLDMHGVYIPGTRSMKIKDSISEIIGDIRNTFGANE